MSKIEESLRRQISYYSRERDGIIEDIEQYGDIGNEAEVVQRINGIVFGLELALQIVEGKSVFRRVMNWWNNV